MENLTVLIRTCLYRVPYAYRLKLLVEATLTDNVHILNTGSSVEYSQKSILQISEFISTFGACDYVLVLEDDAVFQVDVLEQVRSFKEGRIDFLWLTIPNSKFLKEGLRERGLPAKYKTKKANYSGAVWFSKGCLKAFIVHYCLHHLELVSPTFDLSLSEFVSKRYGGYIPFKEGVFATDHTLPSSVFDLGVYTEERVEVEASVLDLGFNFKFCLREIEDVRGKDSLFSDSQLTEHESCSEG